MGFTNHELCPYSAIQIPLRRKNSPSPSPASTRAQALTTQLQRGILRSLLQALHGLHELLVELVDHFFQETRVLQALPESKGVIWRKRKRGTTLKSSERVSVVICSGFPVQPPEGEVLPGCRHRVLGQSPAGARTRRRAAGRGLLSPSSITHKQDTEATEKPIAQSTPEEQESFYDPPDIIFSPLQPHQPPGRHFDTLGLRNSFTPSRRCSQTARRQDTPQRCAPVSGKRSIPGEPRAGPRSSPLPFPSFPPPPPSSLCPGSGEPGGIPSRTSDAGAPVAGILARFYGDRSRGSVHCNQQQKRKEEKKKQTQVLIFLCIFHGAVSEGRTPLLPSCDFFSWHRSAFIRTELSKLNSARRPVKPQAVAVPAVLIFPC